MAAAPSSASASERVDRLTGIAMLCLAAACFACLDASAKWLGRGLPTLEVTFARYFVHFAGAAIILNPLTVKGAWTTRRPMLQILRGLLLFASTVFNFIALKHLQLAETMAINFAAPFLIALAAGPLLGEWVGARRWGAILVGFSGILVVTRPGMGAFDPAVAYSLGCVVCSAGYSIITRLLAGVDSPSSMLVISAAIPVALMAPVLPGVWVTPPDALTWGVLAIPGLFGLIGHFFLIRAYSLAPASVVAPFSYTQIIWMVLLGYTVFSDLPGANTMIGAGIVVASGLYLLYRERAVKGTMTPPPPDL